MKPFVSFGLLLFDDFEWLRVRSRGDSLNLAYFLSMLNMIESRDRNLIWLQFMVVSKFLVLVKVVSTS